MEETPALLVFLVLMLMSAMAFSFIWWVQLLFAFRNGLELLPSSLVPAQPRERPFWSPGDALLMFGSMQVIAGLAIAAMLAAGWVTRGEGERSVSSSLLLIGVTLGAGVIASLITMAWLRFRERNFFAKLSLRLNDTDGILGLKASLLVLPPVLVISAIASLLVTYEHPVLDSMVGMDNPLVFAVIFIGTAIVTPFVEEFQFRVLLQGGLERIADPPTDADTPWQPKSYWPIFVTSLVFAMMHLGQGAAPVPLFFLSVALGFLYRQTGNITAPMIVHIVLNGTTIVIEGVRVMG